MQHTIILKESVSNRVNKQSIIPCMKSHVTLIMGESAMRQLKLDSNGNLGVKQTLKIEFLMEF